MATDNLELFSLLARARWSTLDADQRRALRELAEQHRGHPLAAVLERAVNELFRLRALLSLVDPEQLRAAARVAGGDEELYVAAVVPEEAGTLEARRRLVEEIAVSARAIRDGTTGDAPW